MAASVGAQSLERIPPGQEWPDRKGEHINAHGGGLLFHEGKYYWYGENRPARGFTTEVGVEVYSSSDLMNWEDEGVALAVSEEAGHDIERVDTRLYRNKRSLSKRPCFANRCTASSVETDSLMIAISLRTNSFIRFFTRNKISFVTGTSSDTIRSPSRKFFSNLQ